MKVELISTGDEVITGMIDDTNASWLCQELLSLGVQVTRRTTVGDALDDLVIALEERSREADVIIFNGGLGPTTDDATTEAVCRVLGVQPVLLEDWLEHIREWHRQKNREMPESNQKQALIPEGAEMIVNPFGTACGYHVRINRAHCFFTPGVPQELNAMFSDTIRPYLLTHFLNDSQTVVKRLFTFGSTESGLQDKIGAASFPEHIVIGYRACYPTIEIKIIGHAAAQADFEAAVATVKGIIGDYIYLEDEGNLPEEIKKFTGEDSFVIFDNVTEGLLGVQLAQNLSVRTVLATNLAFESRHASILGFENHTYALVLDRDVDSGGVHILLNNNKLRKDCHFFVNLDVLTKERGKKAYALITQIIFYQLLTLKTVSLRPDNSVLIDLTEMK